MIDLHDYKANYVWFGKSTGYGCATLLWLLKHKPDYLAQYDRCGTIMDYFAAKLTGEKLVKISTHNAASWGYYNTEESDWNRAILEAAGFPVTMLPLVVPVGSRVGSLKLGIVSDIKPGTPVTVALGDLQVQ